MRTVVYNASEGPGLQSVVISVASLMERNSAVVYHGGRVVFPEITATGGPLLPPEAVAIHCFAPMDTSSSSSSRSIVRIIFIDCVVDVSAFLAHLSRHVGRRVGSLLCRVHLVATDTRGVPTALEHYTRSVDTTTTTTDRKRQRAAEYKLHAIVSRDFPESASIHIRGVMGVRYGTLNGVPLKTAPGSQRELVTIEYAYCPPDGYEDANMSVVHLAASQKKAIGVAQPPHIRIPIQFMQQALPQCKALAKCLAGCGPREEGVAPPVLLLTPTPRGAMLIGRNAGSGVMYMAVPVMMDAATAPSTLAENWNAKRRTVAGTRRLLYGDDHSYLLYASK